MSEIPQSRNTCTAVADTASITLRASSPYPHRPELRPTQRSLQWCYLDGACSRLHSKPAEVGSSNQACPSETSDTPHNVETDVSLPNHRCHYDHRRACDNEKKALSKRAEQALHESRRRVQRRAQKSHTVLCSLYWLFTWTGYTETRTETGSLPRLAAVPSLPQSYQAVVHTPTDEDCRSTYHDCVGSRQECQGESQFRPLVSLHVVVL